ncbi:MAG TPA: hypothetical protein VK681_39100 [Reyranella sp.]|nr:hypothetical protein [Reyranella sp.]
MKRRDVKPLLPSQQATFGLFDQLTRKPDPARSIAAGREGLAQASAGKEELIAKLVPIARELADKAGRAGIIPADVRYYGELRGLIPKSSDQRFLSFLPTVMRRDGLEPTGERRRSFILKSHGNSQMVYRRAA